MNENYVHPEMRRVRPRDHQGMYLLLDSGLGLRTRRARARSRSRTSICWGRARSCGKAAAAGCKGFRRGRTLQLSQLQRAAPRWCGCRASHRPHPLGQTRACPMLRGAGPRPAGLPWRRPTMCARTASRSAPYRHMACASPCSAPTASVAPDTGDNLRRFFEVDRYRIAVAALSALADEGTIERQPVADAIAKSTASTPSARIRGRSDASPATDGARAGCSARHPASSDHRKHSQRVVMSELYKMAPEQLSAFVRGMPKAELHIHIEGSLELELIFAWPSATGCHCPTPVSTPCAQPMPSPICRAPRHLLHAGASVLLTDRTSLRHGLGLFCAPRPTTSPTRAVLRSADAYRSWPFSAVIDGLRRACEQAQRVSSTSRPN